MSMMRTFDVSNRLPDAVANALLDLDTHFAAAGIRYVVVGALARDAVTSFIQDEQPQRATKDVDLAIGVTSMEQFREVTDSLLRAGKHEHKFVVSGLEVDLVPFFIEGSGLGCDVHFAHSILDVSGLEEASKHAERVLIRAGRYVSTASIGALCLLKILAWRDRQAWTSKDALDLHHLFLAADKAPYDDEAWANSGATEIGSFDGLLVGAAWLGLEASKVAHVSSHDAVLEVLTTKREELVADMGGRLDGERLDAFTRAFRSQA